MKKVSKINIAIDGYSSCGKSTLAKGLARELKFNYIDSGAMYRVITFFAIRSGLNEGNYSEIVNYLSDLDIQCKWSEAENKIYLNEVDLTDQIRQPEVQNLVSQISTLSEVRKFLVRQQQEMAKSGGTVMDGRDIGTVVLPKAELKIFMTAELGVRIQRRLNELRSKGFVIDEEEVSRNLQMRDHLDSTRDDSPLRQAEDALVLDNSYLSPVQQLTIAKKWAFERMGKPIDHL